MSTSSFESSSPGRLAPEFFQKGYSDFWRRNKSSQEAVELANVLRALRKVAGHIGMNVGNIIWSGMYSEPAPDTIQLDPVFVYNHYPVPPGKMDILVGIVVHEAYHKREWSDFVWNEVEKGVPGILPLDRDILWRMVCTGEDIYIDHLAAKKILGLYVKKARDYLFARPERSLTAVPTPATLFYLWHRKMLDQVEWPEIHPEYHKPLRVLVDRTPELLATTNETYSLVDRCKKRSVFYLGLWEDIKDYLLPWERDPIEYFKPVKKSAGGKKKAAVPGGKQGPVMSPELAAKIEQFLAAGTADLTPLIKAVCGDDPDLIPTSLWDFSIPARPMADPYLVARLKGIFQTYADRVQIINRGLESGKVDRSRLYRAPIDGRCFLVRQSMADLSWNISILVDASASMYGSRWRVVENTVAALKKALEGNKNKLSAFGYLEHDGVAVISNLIRKDKLFSLPPHGRTPSGQAIFAAALLMPQEGRRRFIIHITDGESNCGCSVQSALEYCKKVKIDIVTLGCGYKDRDILVRQYGKSLQFLDYFEQLPKALENLLRRKILYGG